VDEDPTKQITKLVWSLGNYEAIARRTMPAAMQLVDAAGVAEGDEVLDVATGSGNVAIHAAQRGAVVKACDLTPAMIDLARARAEREGVRIEAVEGDAEDLPYEDGSFDHVFSTFGAMFAPRPEVAAAELFRVTRPGGLVGMANWAPDGLFGHQTRLLQSYAPGGVPGPDPMMWGDPDVVAERLGPLATEVEVTRLSAVHEYESWDAVREDYETNLGPAIALRNVLDPDAYEEMMGRLRDLYTAANRSGGERFVLDAEYLQVIARKPQA